MEILNIFNNREKSIILWTTVILILILFNSAIRKSIWGVLKSFFVIKLQIPLIFMVIYVTSIVLFLSKINLWEMYMLKDTLVYGVGIGLALFFDFNKAIEGKKYFISKIKDVFRISVIIDFIINFYVFSFWQELIFFPIITFLYLLLVVSKTKKEFAIVTNLLTKLFGFIGLSLIVFAIYKIVTDYGSLFTINNLFIFLIPPVLTLLYLPVIYVIALVGRYEWLFKSIETLTRNHKRLSKYTKWRLFRKCLFNIDKLNKFYPTVARNLYQARSKKDIDKIFNNNVAI